MGAVIELYNTDTQIDPCADIGGYLNGGDTEPSPSFQIDCRHQFCQRNFAKFQDHCLLNALDRLESIHHNKSKVKVNHQQAALFKDLYSNAKTKLSISYQLLDKYIAIYCNILS